MPDENNLQSVEAALAAPHNQPKQDVTDLAPAVAVPGDQPPAAPQGVPSSLAPQGVMTTPKPEDVGVSIVDAALSAAKDGVVRNGFGATPPKGGAIEGLVKSLRATARPVAPAVPPSIPAQPVVPTQPIVPSFQVTEAPSAFGRGDSFGYDYGGARVELPVSVDAKNPAAVKQYADFTNQVIDWMNDEED